MVYLPQKTGKKPVEGHKKESFLGWKKAALLCAFLVVSIVSWHLVSKLSHESEKAEDSLIRRLETKTILKDYKTMVKSLLQVSTTDTLAATQRAQGEALAARLRAGGLWTEDLFSLAIYFRERLPWLEDCLIYRPAQRRLTIYWGLSSSDDLEAAASEIAPQLTRLGLQTDHLAALLSTPKARHRASALLNPRRVLAYYTGEYEGDGPWRCRLNALPKLYPAIDLAPIAQALNEQPPDLPHQLPPAGGELTYQLYRQLSRPADGLLHHDKDNSRLLIEVPLSAADFPRMKEVVGPWLLGSLRGFLGVVKA